MDKAEERPLGSGEYIVLILVAGLAIPFLILAELWDATVGRLIRKT